MDVQRFNVKDVFRDDTKYKSQGTNRVVGKKYLDTPARAKRRILIRALGSLSFIFTIIASVSLISYWTFPSLKEVFPGEAFLGLFLILIIINHLGLLVEMAADSLGKNWFARAAGVTWITFFGYFLIGALIHAIQSMF